MKYYIYTYTSKMQREGYRRHTVSLYRIKRNKLVYIDTMTQPFSTEFQLVMMIMAKNKELPSEVFKRGYSAWSLKEDGIADIQRI
jgi:hypothetical protein